MIGATINKRNRWKCDFCNHATYKTMTGALRHVHDNHALELAEGVADELRAELSRERAKPPVVKERIVYRDRPVDKTQKYYYPGAGIYCESCKVVNRNAGIPEGQTLESTPHHCGNRTIKLVLEIK